MFPKIVSDIRTVNKIILGYLRAFKYATFLSSKHHICHWCDFENELFFIKLNWIYHITVFYLVCLGFFCCCCYCWKNRLGVFFSDFHWKKVKVVRSCISTYSKTATRRVCAHILVLLTVLCIYICDNSLNIWMYSICFFALTNYSN